MNNLELQNYLKQYPDDMPIKLLVDHTGKVRPVIDFTDENIMLTSETAYVDPDAPEDEHDCEDGKICLGDGQQYLLFNPIIV